MNKGRINELLTKIKGGDKYAMEELYGKIYSSIYTTAFIYVKNKYDAEDISEEVFWKIITYDGDPVREPVAWIREIIRNDCFNYLKKQNRVTAVEDIELYSSSDISAEEVLILKEIICNCDETEQRILIDHVFWKYSLKTLSEDLGLTYITIKRKYQGIKEKLKKFLKS